MIHEVTQLRVTGGADAAWLAGTASGIVREIGVSRTRYRGLEGGGAIRSLWSDNRTLIASDSSGRVQVWDRLTGEPMDRFTCPHAIVQCARLDSERYFCVDARRRGWIHGRGTGGDGRPAIPVMRRQAGDAVCEFDRFAVIPGGRRVVLQSAFSWMIWDAEANEVIEEHHPVDSMHLVYMSGQRGLSSNGRFFFVYWDEYLLIETAGNRELGAWDVVLSPTAAALSDDAGVLVLGGPDGELAAVGKDGGSLLEVRRPTEESILILAISPGGETAGYVTASGEAGIVDLAMGGAILLPADEIDARLGE